MRVIDLHPGMEFESILPDQPGTITFIAMTDHPYYSNLTLVIWSMPKGEIMFDALHRHQELPSQPLPGSYEIWRKNLGRVLKLTGERSN